MENCMKEQGYIFKGKNILSSELFKIKDKTMERDHGLFAEGAFHDLLEIERKRAERSKRPFMLLLMSINGLPKTKKLVTKLGTAVTASCRSIDIKGWYEHNRVIGIIYTEIVPEKKGLVIEKIRKNLRDSLSEIEATKVGITCVFFPHSDSSTDQEAIERFYPELLDTSLSTAMALGSKRVFDVLGSIFGIILSLPFLLIIPLLIKMTSKGPVLFKQHRVGIGGREFTFLKFRSMYVNNDPTIHIDFVKSLIQNKEEKVSGQTPDAPKKVFKLKDDPRITPLGKFIRKTSLDELPQFFNVLIGQMSLVGPRPAIPYEVKVYEPWHLQRVYPVKPGITGMWQAGGRSNVGFDEMVRMDIQYVQNWSVFLDLKLVFKTAFSVIASRGAY
jgi:lipopolysaccharide/colanic/teichoic acid biosynthesis glycosyltransferase